MSFNIALSGLNAINNELDTISNNIANSATYGFKSSRANFASMYAGSQPTGTEISSLTQSIDVGGNALSTGRSLDASIQGRGFFVVRDDSGAEVYTRVGIFAVDKDGYLVDGFQRQVQGYAALEGTTALGAMGALRVPEGQIPAEASTELQYVGNLSADWVAPTVAPFDRTNPQTYNGSLVSVLHDSLGVQHTVTQYFVKTNTNEVTVHYAFDGAGIGTTTTLQFNTSGQLVAPVAAVPVALGTPTGAAPLAIEIDYAGTTQFAGDTSTTVNRANGNASGALVDVRLAEDGAVVARYSNGMTERVGTVALASFPAEGSLEPIDSTSWRASSGSGDALYFTPGTGMVGRLSPGALEQSNVEMTEQLVGLMSAQRNYQANSKVISAQNEMMQTLMQAI